MREFILENLMDAQGLNLLQIVLNNVVAMAGAFFLMFVYKITYSGAAYSRKFNVSLGMIVIVTTTIMCVIGNNVALSLGMVGALSIIRFRTAVKDARDAVINFWAQALGIGCGDKLARRLRAELLGGVILILIGVKILVEHLFLS